MAPTTPIPIDVRITVEVINPLDHPAPAPADGGAAVREFLALVDPAALEAEALGRLEETAGNVIAAVLLVLHDHADDR